MTMQNKNTNLKAKALHSLQDFFLTQKISIPSDAAAGLRCNICGQYCNHIYYSEYDIPVCSTCMKSEVYELGIAADLLYLTYGNFSRLFDIRFRYPNLIFLHSFSKSVLGRPNWRTNVSNLIRIEETTDDNFTIAVHSGVPYGLMEELYVGVFAQQFLRSKKNWKKMSTDDELTKFESEKTMVKTAKTCKIPEEYKNSQKLVDTICKLYPNALTKPQLKTCCQNILICYLYNVGRIEQADLLCSYQEKRIAKCEEK